MVYYSRSPIRIEPSDVGLDRCAKCGNKTFGLRWQLFANGTRHIRVECGRCDRFVKYLRQTPAALLAVRQYEGTRA
jgi:hypothetical protein